MFALADASILAGTEFPELFPVAVSIALISVAVLAALVGVLSGMRYCIAGAQEVTVVILATMVVSVSGTLELAGISEQSRLPTVIATLLIATITVGLVCLLAGHFRLGRFVRYMPYPVISGFLAGASLLLIKYSIEMAIGEPLSFATVGHLFSLSNLAKLVLAAVICIALFTLSSRFSSGSVIISLIVIFLPAFYALIYLSGVPMQDWIQSDWTLIRSAEAASVPVLNVGDFHLIEWGVVLNHLPQMGSLALITLITALIKISTLESIARIEVNQDKELHAIGVGNVVAGFAGGILGFHTLSVTEIARRMAAPTRITGVGVLIVCLAALFLSGDFLAFLPRFIFAGIILWISIDLFISFFVNPLRQLPRFDTAIVIAVMLAILFWGFLYAVLLGLVAATLIFVIEYSNINIIRSAYSGDTLRSNVDRNVVQTQYLKSLGAELKIFRLQGYMFFGTAYRLIEDIKTVLRSGTTRYLLLDFKKIAGVDTSANLMLPRLFTYCQSNGICLLVADAPKNVVDSFQQEAQLRNMNEACVETNPDFLHFADLDVALEYYENKQLANIPDGPGHDHSVELSDWLEFAAKDTETIDIETYFTERHLEENELLIKEASAANSMYLVLSGSFNITAETEDQQSIRVRKVGPGSMLGEIALYTGSKPSANVTAAEPSRVACIEKHEMDQLLNDYPGLAAMFHKRIATELADRLADNRRLIELHALA